MSLSTIKDWLATVDLSHTDWRLRWPLLILPFLLLALLYALLRANYLSGVLAEDFVQLQKLLAVNAPITQRTPAVPAQGTAQGTAMLAQYQQAAVLLEENALLLQQWLQQGRNLEGEAESAGVMANMMLVERTSNSGLPNDTFWNTYSVVLANLETAVIAGEIKTPEARDLIAKLRTQYAQLRELNSRASVDSAAQPSAPTATTAAPTRQLDAINASMSQLQGLRSTVRSLQNRALVIAALSAALFAMLLWGLWRAMQLRQNINAGRNRNEQSAILRLLDEITPLAHGDLRVKATVSEASTGAIADAFNFAVDELRRLVRAVTESSELVKNSVHETRESAHHLARASSVQAREIHRSSNYLNVMSDTMAQLSAHAVESSRIADLSVQHAQVGNKAVQANVDGLQRIREQAEMTSRLMQRLVETTSAINERIRDIQSVAKRTDLLALNATIRSSAHVSNGDIENVSVLSDDVAHLADTLGRATRDIANLSDLIQQDANITLKSMAQTVNELDDGQRTALQASDSLNEIDRVSNELNGLISDIASKSLRQAGVVKQLSANMGVINNITRDSTLQLQDSAKALETLKDITAELRHSVSDFKLPGGVVSGEHSNNPVRLKSKVAHSTVKHA